MSIKVNKLIELLNTPEGTRVFDSEFGLTLKEAEKLSIAKLAEQIAENIGPDVHELIANAINDLDIDLTYTQLQQLSNLVTKKIAGVR